MKLFKLFLVLFCMFIIFCFSNQKADGSSKLSNGFIDKTIVRIYKVYKPNISKKEEIRIIDKYSHAVRKSAHFTIYLILGILVINLLCEFNIKHLIIMSLIVCIFYSLSDEFHQLFIPGRSGELKDALIDSIGSYVGICSYWMFKKMFISKRK